MLMITFRSVLLRIGNVSDKSCGEKCLLLLLLRSMTFFPPPKIVPLCDILEKCCRVGQATDENIIRRMRIAYWIPKATNTHSQCVILIAFPLQQWFCERA
jgi:hypothetical protein